jgi:periplasmic divalent cation tolerance protein
VSSRHESNVSIVLCTFPENENPFALARTLVEEGLAACVSIFPPMQSIYRWQGKVEQASERQLIIKTDAARVEDLKARLAALHPYDVPEVLVLPVSGGSEGYLQWIRDSVGRPSS